MKPDLKQLKIKAKTEADKADGLKGLDVVYKKYLGKKGEIAKVFALLKTSAAGLKRELGKDANLVKKELEKRLEEKQKLQNRLKKIKFIKKNIVTKIRH